MNYANANEIDLSQLRETVGYDEIEGVLYNIHTDQDLSEYGTDEEDDTRLFTYEGKTYRAADVMWVMLGRKVPDGDYITSSKLTYCAEYASENLTPAFSQTKKDVNTKPVISRKGYFPITNKDGVTRWRVQVSYKGKRYSGGYFDTEDEARRKVNEMLSDITENKLYIKHRGVKTLPKYIYPSNSNYKVLIGGKYIGTRKTLSEAVILRDERLKET